VISKETFDEIERAGREWPDGIHTCEQLQKLEPGRRPCTCGRCPARPATVRVSEAGYATCDVRDCAWERYGTSAVGSQAAGHHARTGHRVVVVTTVTEAYEVAT
jgi:hypothetical protein